MTIVEVAAHWSEQRARCYLLHCCSATGFFDAVMTSPQWRSLAEEAAVKIKGSMDFLERHVLLSFMGQEGREVELWSVSSPVSSLVEIWACQIGLALG